MSGTDALPLRAAGDVFVPDWLGPEDHAWLAALLDEVRRFEGEPVRAWRARASEPLRARAPERRRRLATAVLDRLCEVDEPPQDPSPSAVRAALFGSAAAARDVGPLDRDAVLAAVAGSFGLSVPAALERLYADIPGERRLRLPTPLPDPHTLALLTNLRLSQALLCGASEIEIDLASRSRALVRQVLWLRLLCTVRPHGTGARIEVSGPFTLFRHTTLYGRALAALVPALRGAESFVLRARCGDDRTVRLTSADPIFPPGLEPRPYDSKLEERFARDFAKRAPDWDLHREPEPVSVGGAYVFPDFALVDRRDRARRWLLEIVGFWTPDYLAAKLARLKRSGRRDLIVCVDEKLACREEDLPTDMPVFRFRGRVDVEAVFRHVESNPPAPAAAPDAERILLGRTKLFLDFAGRLPAGHPAHGHLAALGPGDPVELHAEGARIAVRHPDGTPLAYLSNAASAELLPRLGAVVSVCVSRLDERHRDQSGANFRSLLQVERWRVPVLDVEVRPGW